MTSADDVLRIARLARIEVQEQELENLRKKFSTILDYFKILEEADTHGIKPLFHAAERMELRADIPEPTLAREDVLRNAPDQADNCFRIPKVVGDIE
jgi:aspartyl-tRNA(Asn)/glutamyl-tRNA(Gln) amidotransferase subunit C